MRSFVGGCHSGCRLPSTTTAPAPATTAPPGSSSLRPGLLLLSLFLCLRLSFLSSLLSRILALLSFLRFLFLLLLPCFRRGAAVALCVCILLLLLCCCFCGERDFGLLLSLSFLLLVCLSGRCCRRCKCLWRASGSRGGGRGRRRRVIPPLSLSSSRRGRS